MTTTYLAVFNTLLNTNTPRIIFIINSINKTLIFSKNMYLDTIYKYVDIFYIITDFTKAFTTIAATSTTISEPFTTVQKQTIFGSRYQRTSLASVPFENNIFAINAKFILISKTKVILIAEHAIRPNLHLNSELTFYVDNPLKLASFIPINNTVYTIITDII